MKKRVPRRRRMKKGGRKYNRVAGGRLQLKPYTFNFKPVSQAIISNLITPGAATIAPNAASVPLLSANFAIRSNSLSSTITSICDWTTTCTFALSDLANAASYSSVFDAYRINYVTVTLYYLNNTANAGSLSLMPTFYMYQDQDDILLPGSATIISGKQGVKKWQPTTNKTSYSFRMRPCVNTSVEGFSNNTLNAVIPSGPTWLDCVNPSIPHFGFKLYCQDWTAPGNAAALNVVRVSYNYNISFRSPLQNS